MSPRAHVQLIGGLRVTVDDRVVDEADWPARRPMELVALLALADGRRLPRERVVEMLWPHLSGEAGAANLRKAAHHARRTLGDPDAIVLRGGVVALLPEHDATTDLDALLSDGRAALASGDAERCASVAAAHEGELLPGAPYEEWTQDARRAAAAMRADLLRAAGDWEGLLALEPTDEDAARRLMEDALDAGRRHHALRVHERLRLAMVRDLGRAPGDAVRALYDRATVGARREDRPLVGRAAELAQAVGHLATVPDEGTAALLLRGPAGIGKSTLGDELLRRATERGWRTLTVTATAAGAPYGALGGLVEQLLVHGRAAFDALPEHTRRILATLSPAAAEAGPPESALTRHQVVGALRRAIELPGDGRPTVLRVEDAHLADEATADVLHQLVAGGGVAVLVVLAYRAEWIRTSLPGGVTELSRNGRTLLLDLGALPDDELADVVRGAAPQLDATTVAEIVAAAAGSPFVALELARGRAAGADGPLPHTVREAILARLVGLDDPEMDGLAALAVAEDDLDLASVVALTGGDEDDAFRLLDDALAAGALVVAGARYRFRHDLVRQALTDGLPEHRRIALHRVAAERLATAGAEPALVARHWLQGGRADAAVPHLLEATRRAVAVGAFADALTHVERALKEASDDPEGLVARAEILDALGDPRAPDAYARAADAVGDPEAQELRARQALAQLKASDPESALRTLQGVTPRSTVGRLAEALTLSAAAAIGRYADHETAMAKAEEAHRLATELGDPGFVLDATWALALAAHSRGELPVRLRAFLEATHDLPELATRVFDGQLCVTERMLYGGLPNDEIIAFADGLAGEAQRLGAARGEAFAMTLRGEATILTGRLEDADRDFAEGARLHGRIGAVAGEALSLLGRAQVAVQQGRPEHARPYLRDALAMARESEVGHHTLDRIYGTMVEAATDPREALAVVEQAETAIRGPAETCPTCRIAYLVPATIAAARAGDLDRAHRYAADCDRALEIVALPPAWHAAVEEARGHVARAEGRDDDARAHFAAAADGFRTWGQPLDAERCDAAAT